MFRWISYSQLHVPGNQWFKLDRHESLTAARVAFEKFCRSSGYDSSMTLYAYSTDAWESAKDFEDTGCPFDYPDRMLSRGPRNGVKLERC